MPAAPFVSGSHLMWPSPLNIVKERPRGASSMRSVNCSPVRRRYASPSDQDSDQTLTVVKRRESQGKKTSPAFRNHGPGSGAFDQSSTVFGSSTSWSRPALSTMANGHNCSLAQEETSQGASRSPDIDFRFEVTAPSLGEDLSNSYGNGLGLHAGGRGTREHSNLVKSAHIPSYTEVSDDEEQRTLNPRLDRWPPRYVHLLEPRIKITPESRVVAIEGNRLWVAIEVLPPQTNSHWLNPNNFSGPSRSSSSSTASIESEFEDHKCGSVDVDLELRPGQDCRVLQFMDEKSVRYYDSIGSSTSYPSAKLRDIGRKGHLVMVLMSLPSDRPAHVVHSAPASSALFEDLEIHLGCNVVNLLKVTVRVRHGPGILTTKPGYSPPGNAWRELRATAIVKRYDSTSIWSLGCLSPSHVDLFPTMISHWGRARAHDAAHSLMPVLRSGNKYGDMFCTTPQLLARRQAPSNEIEAKHVPQRRASLQRTPSPQPLVDRAPQIWMSIRRAHSGDQPGPSIAHAKRNMSSGHTSFFSTTAPQALPRIHTQEPPEKENRSLYW
ncbi:uncharacterized protein B0I36DRAFT_115508 [Microdochium trichocladiopsis]|uniref:Uncharacterized protein n=1 Tax=Microdochium trichocladiopsis TaxID=1682393 RepID=A0A9P9BQI1_9PEZI|nr:uncharacterized protein B0I36DRAFT_115508 [Microdochium trichocladiopsis]KAH7030890.1 hypothetical protein B0I36DRAFT_115508 [Microdochium trichocladiopsis]